MTSYHTLTAADLDVIASGEPDASVIQTLLSAQYSKRLLMVKAILDVAADQCPADCDRLETAYGLLAAAQQTDPETVQALLTHPSTGLWAAHCLRRLQTQSGGQASLTADLSQLAAIAAAAAIRVGQTFAIEVPVHDRAVVLPSLGRADLGPATPGPETPAAPDFPIFAIVTHDGRQVTITAGQIAVRLPPDPSQDAPGWHGLRSLRACQRGISISVEFDDLVRGRDADGVPFPGRQSVDALEAWQSSLDSAWATLTRYHPRRARALAAGLRRITPLTRRSKYRQSMTNAASVGDLLLTPPEDPLSFAETLVHEFLHSVLAAVADIAPLHNASPGDVCYAPWREDPRPIDGMFQGTYSYIGITGYWEAQREALAGRERALADFEFARWRHPVRAAARVLLESGTLTETGTVIARGMAATAERWCGLSVAEEPRQSAERAAADHRIRWRLRHCQPDQASIDAIVLAWELGQACPGHLEEIPATVLTHQQRRPRSERAPLLRLRLADPDQFRKMCVESSRPSDAGASVSTADLAYAAGDFGRAAEGYRAAIQATPGDIEAWSGLILATAELSGQTATPTVAPEVVRPLYLAILESCGTSPDLDKLQEWMGMPREP
jgi:HEXXH motif-containing protein